MIVSTNDAHYHALAAAIRARTGSDALLFPAQMPDAVEELPIFWVGTQEEYDAILEKDPNTYYCIEAEA